MKKYVIGLLLMIPSLISCAQDEKNIVFDENAQVRKLNSFSSIDVSGAIDLYISQGKESAVAVSAQNKEWVNNIKTDVRNNVLYIYYETKGLNWKKWTNSKIKAYVTVVDLKRIEASGACNVKTANKLKLDALELELSGASDLTGSIDVRLLDLKLSGASNLSLEGNASNARIVCSGASLVKAYNLLTDYAKVIASGASSVRIHVEKELNASASGASNIVYKGACLKREISNSGASSIKYKAND